jgi:putative phosphoesterase
LKVTGTVSFASLLPSRRRGQQNTPEIDRIAKSPARQPILLILPGIVSLITKDIGVMRVGILGDTHDKVERTRAAVRLLVDSGAEVLVHCGDITIPEVVHELAPLPSFFVFGNCDFELDDLRRAIATVGGTCLERGGLIDLRGHRLAVTHGDSADEIHRLEAERPDYLFSGHTHKALDIRCGPTRLINPGALHRAPTWTVAVLDLASGALELLPIRDTVMRA